MIELLWNILFWLIYLLLFGIVGLGIYVLYTMYSVINKIKDNDEP